MTVSDLLLFCNSISEKTSFYCYENSEDYFLGGVSICHLNREQLSNLYGDLNLKRFYIYSIIDRIDVLIDFSNYNK